MASLEKRKEKYLIVFTKRINEKRVKRRFQLKAETKREAERLHFEIEDKVKAYNLDPFSPDFDLSLFDEALLHKKRVHFLTVTQATELFLSQRHQANEVTKANYQRHFKMMFDLVGATMPLSLITEVDLCKLCFKDDISDNTKRSYLTHYKVFFGWAFEQGYVKTNISANVKPPKGKDTLSNKIISEEQLNQVILAFENHVSDINSKYSYLNMSEKMTWFKPIVYMAFYTGMRISEIANLKWKDVDFDMKLILVRNSDEKTTKSGKSRSIPIFNILLPHLLEWKENTFINVDHYVFKSPNTPSSMNIRAGTDNISKKFKRFSRIAGLDEGVTFHGLRHSFATIMLKNNIPLPIVTKVLGHQNYQTTMKYEHINSKDIQDAFKGY